MIRSLFTLTAGICVGVCGMAATHHDGKEVAKPIAEQYIAEKIDGKEAKVSFVEVTLEPGQEDVPHRHPGPVFGYVLEGEFEWAIDDQPAKVLKTGATFYEPTGCLHRVAKNPAQKGKTRHLAVVVYPRDAKGVAIPEPKK
jgi:quercetin dioxygenase-like cupin family protein